MSYNIKSFSDQELYRKCQEYGGNARMWMKKFAGLLPEVYLRKLYKRRGCASIYEFAAKLAGMSENLVDKILNLSEKLKDKPKLMHLLESGEVGWSKIEPVAFIANKETDELWAEKVKTLPQQTLQEYVKEYRLQSTVDGDGKHQTEIPQDAEKGLNIQKSVYKNFSFPMSAELEQTLRMLKQGLEKEKKTTLSWNKFLLELAQGYQEKQELEKALAGKIIVKKEIKTQMCPECVKRKMDEQEKNRETTRYIPAESRKIIQVRSRGTCEYPNCNRSGEIYHHTRRFAIKKNHDPAYIRLLCKGHEGILQMGLVENEEGQPQEWRIRSEPEWYDLKNIVDQRVAEFRKEPVGQKLMPA